MRTILTRLLLIGFLPAITAGQSATVVHFAIDPGRDAKPISRFIYGVNRALTGAYADCTLSRLGGNRWTAYNWTNNASNAGNDWHFQNDGFLDRSNAPGDAVIAGIRDASDRGAGIILTIPMAGHVSADKEGNGDVRDSGKDYLQTRFRQSQPAKMATFTLTPNPNSPIVYQDEFVNWVNTKFPYGQTDAERPIFYMLDNEPDLWSSTHAEVHPDKLTYAEIVQRTIDYARAIKKVAPAALVFGPASYGWNGYASLQNAPDADRRDFLSFYLAEMAKAEKVSGHRLLDVLDVHWYPEARADNVRITEDNNTPAVVAARLQAPRSLWDSTYVEESWIAKSSTHGPINLLPRLLEKIERNYPGTKLSISEYNYGGGSQISGGIAEADVLGIFGKTGLFAAAQWPMSSQQPYVAAAFQMYRNFDGKHGAFGDTSVYAATDNATDTSIYASVDSHDTEILVVVAINKTDRALPAEMKVAGVHLSAPAEIYQLTASNPGPRAAGVLTPADLSTMTYTMPPYSVSTLRLRLSK